MLITRVLPGTGIIRIHYVARTQLIMRLRRTCINCSIWSGANGILNYYRLSCMWVVWLPPYARRRGG